MRQALFGVAAVVSAMSVASEAAAQFTTIAPGTRIRLTTKAEPRKPIPYVVDHVVADTLVVRNRSNEVKYAMPANLIDRIDVVRRTYRPM